MQTKNTSIGALVCGILGLVGGWIPVVQYFTLVLSIVAIVLGSKAQKAAKAAGEPTGMATAGLVMGIIGVSFTALMIVCATCLAGAVVAAIPELGDLLQ